MKQWWDLIWNSLSDIGSIREEYKLYLNTILLEMREKFIAIKTLGFWNSLQNESRDDEYNPRVLRQS